MPEKSQSSDNPYPGVNVPDKIIVHHTAYDAATFQYPLVNEWHKQRGFPLSTMGSYVGYHYLIEQDGSMTQCRSESEGGAHARGQNFGSIGICLAGNFVGKAPTSAQVISLTRLMYTIMQRIPTITADCIFPHRHFNNTECYGSTLSDSWAADLVRQIDPTDMQALTIESGELG